MSIRDGREELMSSETGKDLSRDELDIYKESFAQYDEVLQCCTLAHIHHDCDLNRMGVGCWSATRWAQACHEMPKNV